ncbi:MAG: FhaA domain-containing protein [Anaerolineae bacterium]
MKGLARFEEFAQRVMEGSFARLLGSRLQPVEIAKELGKAMEDNQTIGAGKVFAPNVYRAFLHPDNFDDFVPFKTALEEELAAYLADLAEGRGFAFVGKPRVTLQPDETVRRNGLRIEAHLADAVGMALEGPLQLTQALRVEEVREAMAAAERFVLLTEGREIPLDRPRLTLGRSLDNDIILEDRSVSRHHALLVRRYGRYTLHDLDSANGTLVNGQPISQCLLRDGDVIALGDVELIFRRVPAPAEDEGSPSAPGEEAL